MHYHWYQIEMSKRSRNAQASLADGNLRFALSELGEAVSTAEQNPSCAQATSAMQLAVLTTLLRNCVDAPPCNTGESTRIRDLTSRAELLLQDRMSQGRVHGRGWLTTAAN